MTLRYAWWGGEPRTIAIKKTIALFEKKDPKIKIKPEFTDYQAFWEKFQTQASGGNPPDVFQNAVGFLRKYDKRGVLLDLKTQADSGNLSLDNFRNGVLANGQVDGKQLGIPVGANTMALVIDLKAFKKAGVEAKFGWTWDEYFAALQTIQDKLKIAGDTGYHAIMYLYDLYLRQNGKAFFTDSDLGFTEDDVRAVDARVQAREVRSGRRPEEDRAGPAQVGSVGRARRVRVHLGQLLHPLRGRGRVGLRARADPHRTARTPASTSAR